MRRLSDQARRRGVHVLGADTAANLAKADLARPHGPWVVKPRDGMGSVGVSLVDSVDALPAALDLLPSGVPFLVETFVTGREFSAEGLLVGGRPTVLALTAKTTGAGFVETG